MKTIVKIFPVLAMMTLFLVSSCKEADLYADCVACNAAILHYAEALDNNYCNDAVTTTAEGRVRSACPPAVGDASAIIERTQHACWFGPDVALYDCDAIFK